MTARRKRQDTAPAAAHGDAYEPPQAQPTTEAGDPFPPIEPPAPAAGQWENRTQRPNPYDSITISWKDGYRIRYQEKDNRVPRKSYAEIRFGDGTPKDKPKNFDRIKELLNAKGLTFVTDDRAWGIAFTRDTRGDVTDYVKAVFPEVVKPEEEKRGPHTRERAGEQGIPR